MVGGARRVGATQNLARGARDLLTQTGLPQLSNSALTFQDGLSVI